MCAIVVEARDCSRRLVGEIGRALAAVAAVLTFLSLVPLSAAADSTPMHPECSQKYYCTQVTNFVRDYNFATTWVHSRGYSGSTGNGGYTKWRRDSAKDKIWWYYQGQNGEWWQRESWGSADWHDNPFRGNLWWNLNDTKGYAPEYHVASGMQFKHEIYWIDRNGFPHWEYQWSNEHWHYMWWPSGTYAGY